MAFAGAIAVAVCIEERKKILSQAADSFLEGNGYHVANIFFQRAIWEYGYDFTDKTTDVELLELVNYVKSQIASDPQTYEMIYPYVETMAAGTTFCTGEVIYQYTQGDLYYAFQHVKFCADIVKAEDGSWSAKIQITDTYDFTALRLPNSLGAAANDFGFIMQKIGVFRPLDIDLTVELTSS